ncbi:TPA: RNHCP domain-containing protein [Bacillus cereus]|uniref:RNHCP domain-containing protein n=1 Tax=Bacillus cereus group sp. FL70 TaxID=3040254 RepID=UPI003304DD06|nr:RNHCP domain-containing protein [Bacillus cereus]HDR8118133.1 RNHCP domain-containing protein [Bacillus cereus]
MSRKKENTDFTCENCGANVKVVINGSYRNHRPFCLYSKHLDNTPGDRNSLCKGLMKPLDLEYSNKKGYQIIHQCLQCNKIQKNKVAVNSIQEEDFITVFYSYNIRDLSRITSSIAITTNNVPLNAC